MKSSFVVIIPARYASSRLPGKPLLTIAGIPLLEHVFRSALRSAAESVYVATDDERIMDLCTSIGANAIMTDKSHHSGTDRLAEAAHKLGLSDDQIIVNLQGDEVGMSEQVVNQVAVLLQKDDSANMATVCEIIRDKQQLQDPHVVKLVMDCQGRAMYFSRSLIPFQRESDKGEQIISTHYKHIGLYAYRAAFLQEFSSLSPCELEQQESLEQLRALYQGETIRVAVACESTGIGIDTPEDLEKAREMISEKNE